MIRRFYSILRVLTTIPVALGILAAYITIPIWIIVWVITGWWVYPPGNALLNNIMSWLMVKSATKKLFSGGYYTKKDYQDMKRSLKTQSFD